MRIILLKDVAKLGRRYEVKEVADGYGRNFVIARGLGLPADEKNIKKIAALKSKASRQGLDGGVLELPDNLVIKLSAKANESGHLFASIHATDIAEALAKQQGITLKSDQILLSEPIKTVGEHQIKVKLPDRIGEFQVLVSSIDIDN